MAKSLFLHSVDSCTNPVKALMKANAETHGNMLQINSENWLFTVCSFWPQVPQHLLNDCPWAEGSVLSCLLGECSHMLYWIICLQLLFSILTSFYF